MFFYNIRSHKLIIIHINKSLKIKLLGSEELVVLIQLTGIEIFQPIKTSYRCTL